MRRIRLLSLLAAMLLSIPAGATAQRLPAVVTGRVTIPGLRADSVLVRIESVNTGVWTDSTGRFRIVVPPSRFADGDSVTLGASRIGFRPRLQRIQLIAGREVEADFWTKRIITIDDLCYELIFSTPMGRQLCVLTTMYEYKRHGGPSPPP